MVKQQRNAMKNRITIDVGSQGSGVGVVGVVGDCGARAIFVLQFCSVFSFCHRPLLEFKGELAF
jgi:hypothetical protein